MLNGADPDQVAFNPFSPRTNELPRNTREVTIVESSQQFCKLQPPIITALHTRFLATPHPILLFLPAMITLL